MIKLCEEAIEELAPDEPFVFNPVMGTGSTDMGDLCSVMPVLHPYAGGSVGTSHGSDYEISDPERACVLCAKWQLMMLSLLLENSAERAKKIVKNYKPPFASIEDYLAFIDSLSQSGDRIVYNEDGTATIK